jgi:AcrR family transcriptional regulator
VPRTYDSSRRRAQAQSARRDVLGHARELFLARGFAGTTMAAIAGASGVSVEMLYATWANKAGIVEALLRQALRGEEDAPPLEQGAAIEAIRAAPSARAALGLYGELLAEVQPRLAPTLRLLREGAARDERLAELLARNEEDRLAGMGRFAADLASKGGLAEGLDTDRARDILWTLNSSELYELLVERRGWSAGEYGAWVASLMAAALIDGAGVAAAP